MFDRTVINSVTPETVLNEFHRAMLSPAATKLYVAAWKLLAQRNATASWINDSEISLKARLPINLLPAAQSELARTGLLIIVPGDSRAQYEYVDIEQDETAQ